MWVSLKKLRVAKVHQRSMRLIAAEFNETQNPAAASQLLSASTENRNRSYNRAGWRDDTIARFAIIKFAVAPIARNMLQVLPRNCRLAKRPKGTFHELRCCTASSSGSSAWVVSGCITASN